MLMLSMAWFKGTIFTGKPSIFSHEIYIGIQPWMEAMASHSGPYGPIASMYGVYTYEYAWMWIWWEDIGMNMAWIWLIMYIYIYICILYIYIYIYTYLSIYLWHLDKDRQSKKSALESWRIHGNPPWLMQASSVLRRNGWRTPLWDPPK